MTIPNEAFRLPVADGSVLPGYLARPASVRVQPAVGVIVAHELFGVNPDIRGVTDDLAAAGYLAVAPEFYHRDAPAGHWLSRDEAGRAEGFKLLNGLTREQALADVAACAGWLRAPCLRASPACELALLAS
jgi:carboxymethylenebutenolidase